VKTNVFYHGDCLTVLSHDIESGSIDLIYLDPPFFTGKIQKGTLKKNNWRPEAMEVSYEDSRKFWSEKGFAVHAPAWLKEVGTKRPDFASYLYYMRLRLQQCHRVLKPSGSIYLHCDNNASHYLRVLMDEIFGWDNFQNEIVWWYGGGGASKSRFARKHDNIYFYSKSPKWYFNVDAVREPYSEEWRGTPRADGSLRDFSKGKIPDDVYRLHGVLPMEAERIGYPTQKPIKLLERIILASCPDRGIVLDPFGGCGTTAVASHRLDRQWIIADISRIAIDATQSRACQMLIPEQSVSFLSAPIVVRDIGAVKQLKPLEFEAWVNEFYGATKPNPDRGVDGITPDGIPIQTKSYLVKYDKLSQFNTDIQMHSSVPKPVKKAIVVSQTGFDDSARRAQFGIKQEYGVDFELATPESMLEADTAKRVRVIR